MHPLLQTTSSQAGLLTKARWEAPKDIPETGGVSCMLQARQQIFLNLQAEVAAFMQFKQYVQWAKQRLQTAKASCLASAGTWQKPKQSPPHPPNRSQPPTKDLEHRPQHSA